MKKNLIAILLYTTLCVVVFAQDASDFWTDGRGSVTDYTGKAVDIVIPSKIYGTITTIGGKAFSKKQLTSVTIPNSVTSIGGSAFSENKLTSITIPNSVTFIGYEAFSHNELTSVTIPDSVTSIGARAFANNKKLTAINVDSGNTAYSSQDGVLYNKDKSVLVQWPPGKSPVSIPSTVTSIGNEAFLGIQLTRITIPNSVTIIGNGAFYNNRLTSVTIPNNVTSIGDYAFGESQLISVTIGANMKLGIDTFGNGFEDVYNKGGKQAGTYTRPNTDSITWMRK